MGVVPGQTVVERHSREGIGRTLRGDVLEIGPGHAPFPTSTGARVTFADRSVEGGRDATWPELVGQPRGPDADLDLNLDLHGLLGISDQAFDAVIACLPTCEGADRPAKYPPLHVGEALNRKNSSDWTGKPQAPSR